MTIVSGLVLGAWIVSGAVVWLLGWESTVVGTERRARLHRAVEIHLGLWIFFTLGALSALAIVPTAPGFALAALAALLGPSAGLLLRAGRRAGGRRAFPRSGHWFLAPVRGLALWALLTYEALRRRVHTLLARRAEPPPEEEPTSPLSLRESVQELDSLTLEEIMVPRSQVIALSGESTPRQLLPRIRHARHSLYPVHGESVDHLLGLVRMLDLAQAGSIDRPVRELVVAAPIVPETMRGVALLGDMAASRIAAALVVDEFGSHAGLVTMEDLVEVLVGDLAGEHEVVRKRILAVAPGVYRVDGTCEIEEFNEEIEEVLPEGEYETVAGLFLEHTGRIPQPGDEVDVGRALLEVEEATDRRILWLRVRIPHRMMGGELAS